MERQPEHSPSNQHDIVKEKFDEVQSDGSYEEGMARMSDAPPPYVFCHWTFPEASSRNTHTSLPPAPKEKVSPATMNPPSVVSATARAKSKSVPP